MQQLVVRPPSLPLSTEVYVGNGLLTSSFLKETCARMGVMTTVIIADQIVKDRYAIPLSKQLNAKLLTVPSGEIAKTKEIQEELLNELFRWECNRDTLLIALGGGATTDLVGFIASIYLRGVPLVLIPTTLIAMVDASIGGKTAIDTPFGKNLIGTIYHPKAVFVDPEILRSLPEKEILNGCAEIIKLGLAFDASLLKDFTPSLAKEPNLLFHAIRAKAAIIEQDPTEQGLRRIINFGHTIGHALEALSHYQLSHGEGVAIGSVGAAHLSRQLGYLSPPDFERVQELFHSFPLRLPASYTREQLMQWMTHDKKKASGQIRFVLIDRIGHAMPFDGHYCRPVLPNELETTLTYLEHTYGSSAH